MTIVEMGIVVFSLTGCAWSSWRSGQRHGMTHTTLVYGVLMQEFLSEKLGKDEAYNILEGQQPSFERWLEKKLRGHD